MSPLRTLLLPRLPCKTCASDEHFQNFLFNAEIESVISEQLPSVQLRRCGNFYLEFRELLAFPPWVWKKCKASFPLTRNACLGEWGENLWWEGSHTEKLTREPARDRKSEFLITLVHMDTLCIRSWRNWCFALLSSESENLQTLELFFLKI